MTMATRVRFYGTALAALIIILFVANGILTTVNSHKAAELISANRGDVPAYQVVDLGCWTGELPLARPVITSTTVDLTNNDYTANYDAEAVGGYLWGTGEIVLKPNATANILRHEFGHALLADALVVYHDGDMAAATKTLLLKDDAVVNFGRTSDINDLPEALREVATEYQSVPENIYGSTYYTERLTEYIAQSFAGFCGGHSVPPVVGAWLTELQADGGR
jgi:hypothetical protein